MKILTATSQAAAQALSDKAEAWLEANVENYNAGTWSPIYVSADGATFGIAWEARLAPAFTAAELNSQSTPDGMGGTLTTYGNVIDALMAQAAMLGQPAVPGWSIVPPPPIPDSPSP
jgi:hypothetical protein